MHVAVWAFTDDNREPVAKSPSARLSFRASAWERFLEGADIVNVGIGILVFIVIVALGGLAISLIYGTFASTILTLFVIPLIYYGYCRRVSPEKPVR